MKRVIALLIPFSLWGLGENPEVVAGGATFEKVTPQEEIVRVTDKTIIQYEKFHLRESEKTEFIQPSTRSTLLCRIKGKEPSVLQGSLKANGNLLFINPRGILFSKTAEVNVGTLIASTLDIQNGDFLDDRFRFTLDRDAQDSSIINQGTIQADRSVVFMASCTENEGMISAKTGKIAFLGGEVITCDFDGDHRILFAVEAPACQGFIEQGGRLKAGEVIMQLGVADQLVKSVINLKGAIEASCIEIENGTIRLTSKSQIESQKISLASPGGTIDIEAPLKGRIQQLSILGKKIRQNESVSSNGPIHYTADRIELKGDVSTANSSITMNGPVVLMKEGITRVVTGYIKGDVTFESTLNASAPHRSLFIRNGNGSTQLKGDVGGEQSLKNLTIESGQVIFHRNIGGINSGIEESLNVKSTEIDCLGSIYHAGEQFWNTPKIRLIHEGSVQFKTTGHPLRFAHSTSIFPKKTTALVFETERGDLQLASIHSHQLQPISIDTKGGRMRLQEIGKKVSHLRAEGGDILLTGHLEAEEIFMQAEHYLGYDLAGGITVIPTAIQSSQSVVLNSRQGDVGTLENPLNIQAAGQLFVGAKGAAHVFGACAEQIPHSYPSNPPPHIFFCGSEFYYFSLDDEEEPLKTLAPTLRRRGSAPRMEDSIVAPRRASIYYIHN